MSSQIFPEPITTSGCAATDSCDSTKVKSTPGKNLDLKAVAAPNAAAAAEYYPAIYWYSMVKVPDKSLFPGTGPAGNNMTQLMTDQGLWLRTLKTDGCISCHQLGDKATRTIPSQLGHFNTGAEAWERRIQSGQAGDSMVGAIGRFDTARALAAFGDWTDRVAKGELPKSAPSRPVGIERNIVVTEWDWNTPTAYLHDEIATDRRNPTVNSHGTHLWRDGRKLRLHSLARSGRQQVRSDQIGVSRSQDADQQERPDLCRVALLGQRGDLGQPHQHS